MPDKFFLHQGGACDMGVLAVYGIDASSSLTEVP
jgi:hypothetical protein